MSMIINHSFDPHFVGLLQKLQKKYGQEMFKLEGISRENLDINRFTNKFLETKTTADISVDANANVDDVSMLSWNYEFPKALMKLNSLYHLWTSALKKHGIKRANKMIELEIAGGIRIHDLHGWLMPYSYYGSTIINIKENKKIIDKNGKEVLLDSWTRIGDLFKQYESEKTILPDREVIDLTNKNIYVRDNNGTYTKVTQCLKHKRDVKLFAFYYENETFNHDKNYNGCCGETGNLIVTANHPMIMSDMTEKNAEFVKVGDLLKGNGYYSKENYKITKIVEINSFDDIKKSYQYLTNFIKEQIESADDIDKDVNYVYDISTESHTFNVGFILCHNCWAASLAPIVNEGMPWVKNIRVKPVKHFDTLISNSIKYIYNLSTQCVGAIAVPDLFAYAEYFIRKDFGQEWYNDPNSVRHVKQGFQQWIYGVNDKARGNQSPFTNVSVFDKYWRKAMFEHHTNPDFSTCDLQNLKRTQRLFIDVMIDEQKDNVFTFPVVTACQLKDKQTGEIMDKDWLDWLAGKIVQNNLVNIYTSSSIDSLSSCCRLRNNINPLLKKDPKDKEYTNSFGVGGLSIGSHRVVALNLPQIAYMAKCSEGDNWTDFFKILESRVRLAQDILDIHRETLKFLIKNGNLPMYQYGCMDLTKQYSTVGFIGLFEALEILGLDIRNADGTMKGKEIINLINRLNDQRTAIDGNIRNVEQIPGESAAVTFAAKDKLQFANVDYDLYSNQYIPLIKDALMADRIRIQGEFDEDVSGGSILHIGVDQQMTKEQVISIIQAAAKMNVIYFALDSALSQCTMCKKVHVGRYDKSPCHNAATKKYQRVVGFRTPVESWNKVRRKIDFPNRVLYHDSPFM